MSRRNRTQGQTAEIENETITENEDMDLQAEPEETHSSPANDLAAQMQQALHNRKSVGGVGGGYGTKDLASDLGLEPRKLRKILRALASAGLMAHSHKDRWEWPSADHPEVAALKLAVQGAGNIE